MIILIIAGGNGSRLWPLSRKHTPKQLLPLLEGGTKSLLQATVERIGDLAMPADILLVLSNDFQRQTVREQLPQLLPENILVEPEGKNTTAAIALGAATLAARNRSQDILAVLSADHVIEDPETFRAILTRGEQFLQRHPERLLTIGVTPTYAETGYGYIEQGEEITDDIRAVAAYREKPAQGLAEAYLQNKKYLWNTGIFMWRVSTILERIGRYSPPHQAIIEAVEQHRNLAAAYARVPNLAIDYAVSERDPKLAVLPTDMSWCDIGHWRALKTHIKKNPTARTKNHIAIDSDDCLVISTTDRTIATIGLKNFVIIDTPDALLVCAEDQAQRVREITEELKKDDTQTGLW